MRLLRSLVVVLTILSLAAALHVAHAFLQPPSSSDRVAAQVRWLNRAIADGAPERMQSLFPEGAFFTQVLTGLAAASVGDRATVTQTLSASGAPGVKAGFGTIAELDGGTFYRGWRLLLAAEQVRLSGEGTDALLAEATVVQHALTASPTGVPASYPGGYWPCDAVVAMAAVVRAHQVAGGAVDAVELLQWRTMLDSVRDPATGLLAHRINAAGTILDAPRGSSQSIVQTFWPTIDPAGAAGQWERFRSTFLTVQAGLVGVREYPPGDSSPGDVDSGALILGVSASASAVTLAAARANGDAEVAASLDHEAEYLGVPLEWSGERRFAAGLLPVGDAFVAWARGVPLAATPPGSPAPQPQWGWHVLIVVLPALVGGSWLVLSGRQRRRARSGD